MRSGTIDIDADPFVPHEGPPQRGQHGQLERDSDGEMADKVVLDGLHAPVGIKVRASACALQKCFENQRIASFPTDRVPAVEAPHTAMLAGLLPKWQPAFKPMGTRFIGGQPYLCAIAYMLHC